MNIKKDATPLMIPTKKEVLSAYEHNVKTHTKKTEGRIKEAIHKAHEAFE